MWILEKYLFNQGMLSLHSPMFLRLFSILAVALSAVAEEPEATSYPLRSVDPNSEKFARIYEEVAAQLYTAELDAIDTYNVTILQTISPGQYRVRVGETVYAVAIPGKPLADEEVVELALVETDEVFQYTTVLGATSTIKKAKLAESPEKLSKQQFMLLLEAGQKFPIQMGEEKINCTGCGGFGVTSSVTKVQCKRCRGQGGFMKAIIYSVQW